MAQVEADAAGMVSRWETSMMMRMIVVMHFGVIDGDDDACDALDEWEYETSLRRDTMVIIVKI